MDCEKFEPLLLDELYEELDEVTSAAVKRHVSGCARCASILNGMRSTRRAVALPMLEMLPMPDGLEDRILASVKEAQKVVPIQSRAQRALSWAGNWAMRPQTAMAAVFLLMIGTSAFVIRARRDGGSRADEQTAAVSVTEKGEPAGQAPPGDQDSLDNKAAAAAHGPNMPAPVTPPPVATPAASALALNADPSSAGFMDGVTGGKGRAKADEGKALGSALLEDESTTAKDKDTEARKEESQQRGAEKKAGRAAPPRELGGMANAAAPAGAPPGGDFAPNAQSIAPPATKTAADPQDGFSSGMAAYRTRNFPEATRQFDNAARSGDPNAALWAAKSVKDGNGGCGAAVGRFEAITTKSPGTWVGNEAALESARCQIALGQLDPARDKLTKLTASTSHAAQAQQALNELNEVAARRSRVTGSGGGAGNARGSAAPLRAPQPAPRPPPASADKASGF